LVVWARAGAAARAVKAKKAEKTMVGVFMVASPVFFICRADWEVPVGAARHGAPWRKGMGRTMDGA